MMRLLTAIFALILFRDPRGRRHVEIAAHPDKPIGNGQTIAAWISALGSIGSAATGIFSGIVAWYAYQTTIEFRNRDETKDEFQITPSLSVIIRDGNRIELDNLGLGPAVIHGFYARSGGKVNIIRTRNLKAELGMMYDSDNKPITAPEEIIRRTFNSQVLDYIANEHQIKYVYRVSGEIPLAGEIVKKDAQIIIAKVNSDDIINHQSVSQDEREWYKNVTNMGTVNLNFGVCYCSFTEKSCFYSSMRGGITHQKVANCSDAEAQFRSAQPK